VPKWPDSSQWLEIIKKTLQSMLDSSAQVSWCGLEGFFLGPPALFDPRLMSDGVWAAFEHPSVGAKS